MIDHLDKQTQPLPLEAKRGRGRPATGQALSNAERQRLYRERQKTQRNEKTEVGLKGAISNWEEACRNLGKANERIRELEAELGTLRGDLAIANAKLAQRNEKPSRLNEGMKRIIQDVHEIADAIEGSTWRIQRKARANGRWATLKGSYWNEAQAEDALADLPNKKGAWWRIVEVKSKVED